MLPNCRKQETPSVRGWPVIHQGLTTQMSVPVPHWWGHCPNSLPPSTPLPVPVWPRGNRTGWDFVLSPLEVTWPDLAKFLFIFPGSFGVGRLRNVKCFHVGGVCREVEANVPDLCILIIPRPVAAPDSSGPPVSIPSPSLYPDAHFPESRDWDPKGPGHTWSVALCWKQLRSGPWKVLGMSGRCSPRGYL